MCGIAGSVRWAGIAGDGGVSRLVERLHHRGPDDRGLWRSPDGRCVLGHTRLSVIDLSPAGHQPMIDSLTGNAIVFNGEIYNVAELRAECERRGDRFVSRTDTEVILALYRRLSTKCLDLLRGMFAFAVWDREAHQLLLARDRLGKKPLHYALTDGGIVFASEIDPLARHPSVSRDVDPEGLALYLALQSIPAPWTIYRAIRKLPPATYGEVGRDGLRLTRYWELDYRTKLRTSEPEALERLESQLREAVRLRLTADVPVGALLSGGVDSSLIVALMATLGDRPVRTFSVGFAEAAFNELPYARTVAERYGTDHAPQILSPGIADLLPEIARRHGEPFADSSAVPAFAVCRAARRHVTVALNGDGGDELLGGYPRYWLPRHSIRLGALLGNVLPATAAAGAAGWMARAQTLPARAVRKGLLRGIQPELGSVAMYAEYWHDGARDALLKPEWSSSGPRTLSRWRAHWLAESRRHAGNPVDRMLWIDSHTYLPGDLLVKMDIASMHCGLEARSPLLDHKVVEFCAALPVELKVRHRIGKYLLKRLGERYLPRDLLYRKKMGFAVPVAAWLRGPLAPLVRPLREGSVLAEWLHGGVIRHSVGRLLDGDDTEAHRVWSLLMLALWKETCLGR
jgi:asparagine synthase (glutamine-hydrolysing)